MIRPKGPSLRPLFREGRGEKKHGALKIGIDVRFQDQPIPADEEWYYELDGRTHGPMRWGDLEELLGRAGDTAVQVRVRKGADGVWTAFRSGTQAVAIPAVSLRSTERIEHSRSASPGFIANRKRYLAAIAAASQPVAVVGVWVLLNLLVILYWPEPYAKERRYLGTLQDVVKEADQLRASGAADAEWAGLAKRTKERLAPMVADLKKSASASELPRQQLLWSARDLAPRIMGSPTKEREENELRLKQYLQSVEEAIGHP